MSSLEKLDDRSASERLCGWAHENVHDSEHAEGPMIDCARADASSRDAIAERTRLSMTSSRKSSSRGRRRPNGGTLDRSLASPFELKRKSGTLHNLDLIPRRDLAALDHLGIDAAIA